MTFLAARVIASGMIPTADFLASLMLLYCFAGRVLSLAAPTRARTAVSTRQYVIARLRAAEMRLCDVHVTWLLNDMAATGHSFGNNLHAFDTTWVLGSVAWGVALDVATRELNVPYSGFARTTL